MYKLDISEKANYVFLLRPVLSCIPTSDQGIRVVETTVSACWWYSVVATYGVDSAVKWFSKLCLQPTHSSGSSSNSSRRRNASNASSGQSAKMKKRGTFGVVCGEYALGITKNCVLLRIS